jgi:hypothetical protein
MKTAGEIMLENVNNLIKSEISGYKIWQETGVSQSQISRLRKGEIEVGNISTDNSVKLNKFWEENNMFNKLNDYNSTIIVYDGVELRTIDNPYLDSDVYKAIAVDKFDNKYEIVWTINHPDFENLEDESESCDWDNPASVEKL